MKVVTIAPRLTSNKGNLHDNQQRARNKQQIVPTRMK